MGNLFVDEDKRQLIERALRLHPDMHPQWGTMTVNQMLCHIADPIRDIMGLRQGGKSVPGILKPVMKLVMLSRAPFRKNLPTLKAYLQGNKGTGTRPVNFAYDKATFIDLVNKISSTPETFRLRPHGLAGRLTRQEHGYILWKHIDHHLRQFGV